MTAVSDLWLVNVIYQLVYVSRAANEMDVQQLDEILDTARTNNHTLDITGMLLHHEGSFIQVLEGDEAAVEDLYAKIGTDPRHEDSSVVLRTTVEERAFEQWSMGYKRTANIDEVPEGFHHFLQSGYRRQTDADDEAARKALLAFKEGRWRA
ncbi:MAG: BLUF domain-containing protein [Pseudomonadota bacterium]